MHSLFLTHNSCIFCDLRTQAEAKATRLLIIVLAALHLGVALSFKILFFSYYIKKIGPDITIPGGDLPGAGGNSTAT
jgi:hypothetical protein